MDLTHTQLSGAPETADILRDADSIDDMQVTVAAPSLSDMRQLLKGFATSMADSLKVQLQMNWCCRVSLTRWPRCLLFVSMPGISEALHVTSQLHRPQCNQCFNKLVSPASYMFTYRTGPKQVDQPWF